MWVEISVAVEEVPRHHLRQWVHKLDIDRPYLSVSFRSFHHQSRPLKGRYLALRVVNHLYEMGRRRIEERKPFVFGKFPELLPELSHHGYLQFEELVLSEAFPLEEIRLFVELKALVMRMLLQMVLLLGPVVLLWPGDLRSCVVESKKAKESISI